MQDLLELVKLYGTRTGVLRIYDGWCIYSALRCECELSGISHKLCENMPLYIPPGGTSVAPYGAAGKDCPYPMLGMGKGMTPKYSFAPEVSAYQAMMIMLETCD